MKRIWKNILVFLAVCLLAASLASLAAAEAAQDAPVAPNAHVDPRTPAPTAKPTTKPSPTKKPKPNPRSVKLNKTGTVRLEAGKTLQLKASVSPGNASAKLTWSSSDVEIVKVSSKGRVTAVSVGRVVTSGSNAGKIKPGIATVTVKTQNGKKASVKVLIYSDVKDDDIWCRFEGNCLLTLLRYGSRRIYFDNLSTYWVREIVVTKGVKNVPSRGLISYPNLEKVTVEKGVKTLGYGAIMDCPKLKTVKLPEGLKAIGQFAFYKCPTLKNLTIPRSVTRIGDKGDDENNNIFSYNGNRGGTVIRGYKGSAAQRYAEKCGIKFVAIG